MTPEAKRIRRRVMHHVTRALRKTDQTEHQQAPARLSWELVIQPLVQQALTEVLSEELR